MKIADTDVVAKCPTEYRLIAGPYNLNDNEEFKMLMREIAQLDGTRFCLVRTPTRVGRFVDIGRHKDEVNPWSDLNPPKAGGVRNKK